MNFQEFIVNNNILGLSIGTIIGFAITRWITSIREQIVLPYLIKKYNIEANYGTFISTTLELVLLIVFIYILFVHLIVPSFNKQTKKKEMDLKKQKNQIDVITKNIQDIGKYVNYQRMLDPPYHSLF